MKSNYDVLGKYIISCDELNTEEEITLLQGVNNEKYFQGCKSNTNGIDLSRYRICRKGWFCYNRATTRNGDRISIAYREGEDCLVSPSYKCFKVKDESKLDPIFLLHWFKRSEFDRYARFMSHGSAHEYFEYDQMCDVKLPIPSISQQKKVVKALNVISHRISLKKKINENLMAIAYAIYKNMFVDIPNLPNDWFISPLNAIAELNAGGDKPSVYSNFKTDECTIPIFANGIENEGLYGFTDKAKISEESVTVSARGTVGYVFLRDEPYVPIVRLISVIPNKKYVTAKYLYFALSVLNLQSTGTTQQQITVPDFKKCEIVVPSKNAISDFTRRIEPFFKVIKQNKIEIKMLMELQKNYLTILSS